MSHARNLPTKASTAMQVVPPARSDMIRFVMAHVETWRANPAAIGLTAAQVNALAEQLQVVRAAKAAMESKRLAERAAFAAADDRNRVLKVTAQGLVNQIKAFAATKADPAVVLANARLPVANKPQPRPLPGVPTKIAVRLQSDGAVALSWACERAPANEGVFFEVWRKIGGAGKAEKVGAAPGMTAAARRATFIDSTVPAGAAEQGVTYRIRAYRGAREGPQSAAVTVRFGSAA